MMTMMMKEVLGGPQTRHLYNLSSHYLGVLCWSFWSSVADSLEKIAGMSCEVWEMAVITSLRLIRDKLSSKSSSKVSQCQYDDIKSKENRIWSAEVEGREESKKPLLMLIVLNIFTLRYWWNLWSREGALSIFFVHFCLFVFFFRGGDRKLGQTGKAFYLPISLSDFLFLWISIVSTAIRHTNWLSSKLKAATSLF